MNTMWLKSGAVMAMVLIASLAVAGTVTWNNTGTDWFDDGNWDGGGAPGDGDHAVIASGSVVLTNSTANLASLTMSGGSLTFANWATRLTATNVTINAGVLTLPPAFVNAAMSNRVHILCSNFFLGAVASIDAKGHGYATGSGSSQPGNGPGAGGGFSQGGGGAGHGGFGGGGYQWPAGGVPYGVEDNPFHPGSGGGWGNQEGGAGGGAVRIEAPGGSVVVNGTIDADGNKAPWTNGGGGSGGSVYIACQTFSGTGGVVRANGGQCGSAGTMNGNGGGGRIAVIYDTIAQASLPVPDVAFSVKAGIRSSLRNGDIGTLYFPDARFLTAASNVQLSGRLVCPGFTSWSPSSLVLSNVWLRLAADGFQLAVAQGIHIEGAEGRLDLGGSAAWTNLSLKLEVDHNRFVYSDVGSSFSLSCGGDLVVTNGGQFWIYAGSTNGSAIGCGANLNVGGSLRVSQNSRVYPRSHPTTGASVYMHMDSLLLSAGAQINADSGGWAGSAYQYHDSGFGTGGGARRCGGSYGGKGGDYLGGAAEAYGSSNAPALPGSGGGADEGYHLPGGAGGGLVWIDAAEEVAVDGTITANGGSVRLWDRYPGGGSGGGVYITCVNFTGLDNGVVRANGGNDDASSAGKGGAGGGGRVAIWSYLCTTSTTFTVAANPGVGEYAGGVGTIVWGQAKPPVRLRTVITIR